MTYTIKSNVLNDYKYIEFSGVLSGRYETLQPQGTPVVYKAQLIGDYVWLSYRAGGFLSAVTLLKRISAYNVAEDDFDKIYKIARTGV